MIIEDLLARRNMTKYRLAVQAGIPHATLNDICSGKTKLEKCSAQLLGAALSCEGKAEFSGDFGDVHIILLW